MDIITRAPQACLHAFNKKPRSLPAPLPPRGAVGEEDAVVLVLDLDAVLIHEHFSNRVELEVEFLDPLVVLVVPPPELVPGRAVGHGGSELAVDAFGLHAEALGGHGAVLLDERGHVPVLLLLAHRGAQVPELEHPLGFLALQLRVPRRDGVELHLLGAQVGLNPGVLAQRRGGVCPERVDDVVELGLGPEHLLVIEVALLLGDLVALGLQGLELGFSGGEGGFHCEWCARGLASKEGRLGSASYCGGVLSRLRGFSMCLRVWGRGREFIYCNVTQCNFFLLQQIAGNAQQLDRVQAHELPRAGRELDDNHNGRYDLEDAADHGRAEVLDLVLEGRDVVELEADLHEPLVDRPGRAEPEQVVGHEHEREYPVLRQDERALERVRRREAEGLDRGHVGGAVRAVGFGHAPHHVGEALSVHGVGVAAVDDVRVAGGEADQAVHGWVG